MTTPPHFHLTLIGSGGDGVMATASMILRTAARMGLYGMMVQSYGPQIRGGESAAHVTLGATPVHSVERTKDLVVCFRFSDAARFAQEVRVASHGTVIHGVEEGNLPEHLQASHGTTLPIPFSALLEDAGLPELAKNVLVFGMVLRAMGWSHDEGANCVQEVFSHKSSAVVSSNLRAMEIGYQQLDAPLKIRGPVAQRRLAREVQSGNEACAHAAIGAGCRFFAGYPITPSSEILETMNELLPAVDGQIVQAEDEIASLGMVIGASYGGTPAMTATSGPGFSLMTEMIGLSSMVEIPLVIVNCQRAGPSTGMPSRVEQADLWHALYGGHGDFPRVVLAPVDVASCYRATYQAFDCAERFQLPAIVLSDGNIAQRMEIIDPIDDTDFPRAERLVATPVVPGSVEAMREMLFRRYDLRNLEQAGWNGVSPMAIPGTAGGMHHIAGIEHTEGGMPTADPNLHERMNQKRFRKRAALARHTADWCWTEGAAEAPLGVITWGSSAGVMREYIAHHPDTALFVPEILEPFPEAALRQFMSGRQRIVVLEMNFQGQLFHHLRGLGVLPAHAVSVCRSGGYAFHRGEIERLLNEGREKADMRLNVAG